ncbi:WD-40 repeat protein [Reticulomyxa filosa]|uniref:WD-40 repeat protein n=1 Tax=Reticulomyxa filosa TaxID=46433 RepID=X6NSZ2_RETFI|nr:WD-40 repeat protein [Reticulomyxa filosa]|eukprot:ETO29078.1 WD-40 repeat protein [Reticulomyxa filosa]
MDDEKNKESRPNAVVMRSCLDKNWILQSNQKEQIGNFICLICEQVANNAMELDCLQHENADELLIVGETCLRKYLCDNRNVCPVDSHEDCLYSKSKLAQRQIGELCVICPRQFEQNSQIVTRRHEGKIVKAVMCNFKGKIREVPDHLENACPLRLFDCWFKPFGCDHLCHENKLQEHLISNLKLHFELATKFIESLQHIIQQYQTIQIKINQSQVGQLQLENEKLKSELQLNVRKEKENYQLKQQLQQCEQQFYKTNFFQVFFALKLDISHKKYTYIYHSVNTEMEELKQLLEKSIQQMHTKDKQIQLMRTEIEQNQKDIQLKERQLLEKENEMKRIQQDNEAELLKCYADIEIVEDSLGEEGLEGASSSSANENREQLQKIKSDEKEEEKEAINNVSKLPPFCFQISKNTFSLPHSPSAFKSFNGHSSMVYGIEYSFLDGRHLLCSGSTDMTVRLWDVDTAEQIQVFTGHSSTVFCVKFSSYYWKSICSSSWDSTIRFWNIETGKQTQILNGHSNGVCGFQFSPFRGGQFLCSGSADNTIRLWDIETCKSLYALDRHSNSVWCVEFSPLQSECNRNKDPGVIGGSGYSICSGACDNTVRLWDVETAKELAVFQGHSGFVRSVKYPRSEIICSGSNDKTIRLWDARMKEETHIFKGHTGCVYCIEYLPFQNNSDLICSAARDNTIRFWDVRTHRQFYVIKGNDKDCGIISLQCSVLQSNKQNNRNEDDCHDYILCSGSYNGAIHLWA